MTRQELQDQMHRIDEGGRFQNIEVGSVDETEALEWARRVWAAQVQLQESR